MLKPIADLISFVFNPYFLILPIPYLLVVRQTGDPLYAVKWTIFTAFFLLIIGVAVLYSLRKRYFTDLDISRREQRPLLFLMLSVFSILYFCTLFYFHGPLVLFISLGGIFISIMIFALLNTMIKASIHVASITALIFSFSLLYNGIFLLFLFLIPLIAWSRLYLKKHTNEEVIVGGIAGVAIPLVIFIVFKVVLSISLS